MASFEEIASLGVTISLASNFAQILGPMMEKLLGIQNSAKALESQLGRVRLAAVGVAMAAVGWKLGEGLIHAVNAAQDLNHELIKIQIGARLTDAQRNAVERAAWNTTAQVRGTTAEGNVKQTRELFGVFNNMDEAIALQPKVAEASRAIANYNDKNVDLAQVAIKALELRGHITKEGKVDPKEFQTELSAMVRAIVASEGMIDPQKLLGFIQQAGPAARMMNAEEMWGMAPALMNAMGSRPAGTAMMSLFQQMVGHVLAGKRVAVAMQEAQMLKPGSWRVERGGKVIMDKDALVDQTGFTDHPITWLHEHLQQMRNMKDAHGKPIDTVGVIQEIFQLASRATSARLISDIDTNWPVIQAENARFKRMPGPEQIKKEQDDQDYKTNMANLESAWHNFVVAIGEAGTPAAIIILHGLTTAIIGLTGAVEAHPYAATAILGIASALAALMTVGGLALVAVNLVSIAKSMRALAAAATVTEAAITAEATLAGTAAITLQGILRKLAIPLLGGYLTHEGLSMGDPKDMFGAWMDRNVPGASWLDNLGSHMGLGRSYSEQADVENYRRMHGDPSAPTPADMREEQRLTGGHSTPSPVINVIPPPPTPSPPVNITTQLMVDGRMLAQFIGKYLSSDKAASGTTLPDVRLGLPAPGFGGFGY